MRRQLPPGTPRLNTSSRRRRILRAFAPAIQLLETRQLLTGVPPVTYDDHLQTPVDEAISSNAISSQEEADAQSFYVDSGPENGTLEIDLTTGNFLYTPPDGFRGIVHFDFHSHDDTQNLTSNTSTIQIDVGVIAPTSTPPDPPDSPDPNPCGPPPPTPKGPIANNPNITGTMNSAGGFSKNPVRYFDGVVRLATTDLESDGFGSSWSQARAWTNGDGYANVANNGSGMVDLNLPYLIRVDGENTIAIVNSGTEAYYFDRSGSTYTTRFNGQEVLAADPDNHQFLLTDSAGDRLAFSDFSQGTPF